jgi:hypothetical protein
MNRSLIGRLIVSMVMLLIVFAAGELTIHPIRSRASAQAAPVSHIVYLPLELNYSPAYDWLQFDGDASHSGINLMEPRLSAANVNQLHLKFQVALPAVADGAPVYLSRVATSSGVRNLVFATLRTGGVAAMDAYTGATVWSKPGPVVSCQINNDVPRNEACYTTSSPAIDPNRQFIYSYGLDGYVHKYEVGSGTEVVTGGWPELATLKIYDEKGSSALSLATARDGTSYLYVTNGGYPGDAGNYQGHLTAINLSNGSQKVFNTLCSNQTVHFVDSRVASGPDCSSQTQSALWARAGVIYNPLDDRIYMTTGNGDFAPAQFDWGETVFSLHPDGSGAGNGSPLDSYTPSNFQNLTNTDTDLGSTAPSLLPPVSGKYPHLAVQGGKDGLLRLINLDNLSGKGQAGQTGGEVFSIALSGPGEIFTQPAVWVNPADGHLWVFTSTSNNMVGLEFSVNANGDPSLTQKWKVAPGTSAIVANGVLYYTRSGLISAFNPTSGVVLWSSTQIGAIHWQSPIVANGLLYIEDQSGNLTAFSLP